MEIVPHTLFNYLLEASICLAVFYTFYALVLRRQPTFAYNRAYLLISSLLALILPLLEVPVWGTSSGELSGVTPNFSVMILPNVAVGESSETVQTVSWQQLLLWIYIAGALLMLARLLWQIYGIRKVIRQAYLTVSQKGYWVVYTDGKLPISSFFNYLLWDNRAELSEADKQRIIAHEEVHIAEGHSYDVLYMSLIKILLWFNPFTYLYCKELTDVHEYAADAKVIEATNPKDYAKILVNQLFHKGELSLLNHFYKSQTLKRLKMMELTKSKTNRYRILWALPVFTLMFFVFSCQEERDIQSDTSYYNQEQPNEINILVDANNNVHVRDQIVSNENLKEILKQEVQRMGKDGLNTEEIKTVINVDPSAKMGVVNDIQAILSSLQLKGITYNNTTVKSIPDADGAFAVVDEQPAPEGGMGKFYEYVQKNIKYPQEDRKRGIEGRTFVQFVVDTDGSITEVETLKSTGMDAAFVKEAERVVRSAPAWNPGRQDGKPVKVKLVMPITFLLDDGSEELIMPKREEASAPKMSEIVVVGYTGTGK